MVCGDERPDSVIAVYKRRYRIAGAGAATFNFNVRYCTDRADCELGAWLVEPPSARPACRAAPACDGDATCTVHSTSVLRRLIRWWVGFRERLNEGA
jgi:hypothetical protein